MVQAARRTTLPDKVLMYASVFSYNKQERIKMNDYTLNDPKIQQFESKFSPTHQITASGTLPQGSLKALKEFDALDEKVQRDFLENQ